MGVEADIVIARVMDGHHLITDDLQAVKVTDPVIVLPLHRCVYPGTSRSGLYSFSENVNRLITFGSEYLDCCQVVSFYDHGDGCVFMSARDAVTHLLNRSGEYPNTEFAFDASGCGAKDPEYLVEYWSKITPGYWVVRSYSHSGGGDYSHWFNRIPNGVVLGPDIGWEIWT